MPAALHLDPWQIADASDVGDHAAERIEFALRAAILAPSSHNTQPWWFRIEGEVIELYADRSRALPVVDPAGRELVMSCGAALFHLRTALRAVGCEPLVERMPSGPDPDLLARIKLGPSFEPGDTERRLFEVIVDRHTDRHQFEWRRLSPRLGQELGRAAVAEGAQLVLVTTEHHKRELAELIAEGDRRQWDNKPFRAELAAWSRGNHSTRRDGIPGYATDHSDPTSLISPLVIRTFDLGRGQAARDQKLAEGSPAMAVLLTDWDAPAQWLAAGEALSHVLLSARAAGVSASLLNQPVEEPALRPKVRELLGERGFPQLVLRLGYAAETSPPTPRRGLEDVVI